MVCIYHLVVDQVLGRPVYVFLASPPGFHAHTVTLARLPTAHAVVAQRRTNRRMFAEFETPAEAAAAGYSPLPAARVCDTWAEYLRPCPVAFAEPDDPDAATVRVDAADVLGE